MKPETNETNTRFMPKSTAMLTLEEKIQILMDERDIRNVIYRICRASSRGDVEMLKTCFFDDAVDHHEPLFVKKASEMFADFEKAIRSLAEMVQYSAWQILIELNGDVARTESYIFTSKIFHGRTAEGDSTIRLAGMRLLDRFERRAGEWKIAERWFVGEWGLFEQVPILKEAVAWYEAGTEAGRIVTASGLEPHLPASDRTDLSYHF